MVKSVCSCVDYKLVGEIQLNSCRMGVLLQAQFRWREQRYMRAEQAECKLDAL